VPRREEKENIFVAPETPPPPVEEEPVLRWRMERARFLVAFVSLRFVMGKRRRYWWEVLEDTTG
jgi:hypothetical protein